MLMFPPQEFAAMFRTGRLTCRTSPNGTSTIFFVDFSNSRHVFVYTICGGMLCILEIWTEVSPLLYRENHSKVCSSHSLQPKTFFAVFMRFRCRSPSMKWWIMHVRCSFKPKSRIALKTHKSKHGRFMAAKLARLTQNIAVLQHLVTESYRLLLAAVDPKFEFGNFCVCLCTTDCWCTSDSHISVQLIDARKSTVELHAYRINEQVLRWWMTRWLWELVHAWDILLSSLGTEIELSVI